MDCSTTPQFVWQWILNPSEWQKILILALSNLIPVFESFLFIKPRCEHRPDKLHHWGIIWWLARICLHLAKSTAGYIQLLVELEGKEGNRKADLLGRIGSLTLWWGWDIPSHFTPWNFTSFASQNANNMFVVINYRTALTSLLIPSSSWSLPPFCPNCNFQGQELTWEISELTQTCDINK